MINCGFTWSILALILVSSLPARGAFQGVSSKSATSKLGDLKSDCPIECICSSKKVTCEGKGLKEIPASIRGLTNITELNLSNNFIRNLNRTLLFPLKKLKILDLSGNLIRNVSGTNQKLLIEDLRLAGNQLTSVEYVLSGANLTELTALDLSNNSINRLGAATFAYLQELENLDISRNQIDTIQESTFAILPALKKLNMSESYLPNKNVHLDDKLFRRNSKLETLDLSNLGLIEVPLALRYAPSITTLYLNNNNMTSLRESDLANSTELTYLEVRDCQKLKQLDERAFSASRKLKILVVSSNPKLSSISKDVFKSDESSLDISLEKLDLSFNNLETLPDIANPNSSVRFDNLILNNNPWNCDCSLEWLQRLKQSFISTVHCFKPDIYRQMEIHNVDLGCHPTETHSLSSIITTIIALMLIGSIIAFAIHKSQILRRLAWRDQYGTIYYTKASFPTESS